MTRFDMQQHLEDCLGTQEAFDAVVAAMSDDAMTDLYKYICRCYDIKDETEEDE